MNDMNELIDEYLRGISSLRAYVDGMTDAQIKATPVPGKWSTLQLICHLADFEPVYADRMKRALAEENPTVFSGDPDLFAATLGYDIRNVEEELNLIEFCRKQMARILRPLPSEAWQRTVTHTQDGPITLETLLRRITNHIPHHAKFIDEKRAALSCPRATR